MNRRFEFQKRSQLFNFHAMGGRSMDGVGNDFTHPFEYDTFTQTWTIFTLRP